MYTDSALSPTETQQAHRTMYTDEEDQHALWPRDDEDGTAFVEELYDRTIWPGEETHEGWPAAYSKLFRIYKQAGREFLGHLWKEAHELVPKSALNELAWVGSWTSDAEELPQVSLKRVFPEHGIIILVDALALWSSREGVKPELVLALQAEVAARRLVDAWHKEDRDSRPYREKAHTSGKRHERWTEMLAERLEILKPEYERWYENATASLAAVCVAMTQISVS